METAFEDALVTDYDNFLSSASGIPDSNDRHVLAAALKTEAAMIVTENLKHFPATVLSPLNLEAKSADAFIADAIALDVGRAVGAIRKMRRRLKKPSFTAEGLLLSMEANALLETADSLRPYIEAL